jgi:ATP-dependent Lon protease
MENIFPVGVMGIIENIDEEGSVKITTRRRVQVTHVEYTDGMVQAEAVDLPDIQDISPEEEKEKFDKIKKELMDFAKGFQWGVWVRTAHWDMASLLLPPVSRRHRIPLIGFCRRIL